MKKAVFVLAGLLLFPVFAAAQSVSGVYMTDYNNNPFVKVGEAIGKNIRISNKKQEMLSYLREAIVYTGSGGASGTGGGGWHSAPHHWDTDKLAQLLENDDIDFWSWFYSNSEIVFNFIKEQNLKNTYEALLVFGKDPFLAELEVCHDSILHIDSLDSVKTTAKGLRYVVVNWRTYQPETHSNIGYTSHVFKEKIIKKNFLFSKEGLEKWRQMRGY